MFEKEQLASEQTKDIPTTTNEDEQMSDTSEITQESQSRIPDLSNQDGVSLKTETDSSKVKVTFDLDLEDNSEPNNIEKESVPTAKRVRRAIEYSLYKGGTSSARLTNPIIYLTALSFVLVEFYKNDTFGNNLETRANELLENLTLGVENKFNTSIQ
jgi:hypothetical protein